MLMLIAAIESPSDRDLMTEFYRKNLNALYYEAKKYHSVKEDIDDAVQEAFAKIIDKMDVFRSLPSAAQMRYAMVTVRNICLHQLYRRNKLDTVSFDELPEEPEASDTPEQILEEKQVIEQIYSIIRSLKHETRMVLEQKYILYWTDEEMAEFFGIKAECIRVKLHRARLTLWSKMNAANFQFSKVPIQ